MLAHVNKYVEMHDFNHVTFQSPRVSIPVCGGAWDHLCLIVLMNATYTKPGFLSVYSLTYWYATY